MSVLGSKYNRYITFDEYRISKFTTYLRSRYQFYNLLANKHKNIEVWKLDNRLCWQ